VRVTIFGATGATGQLVTRKALDDGHDVTVYARNPAKLDIHHDRLAIVKGDLADHSAIAEAVAGRDAVISILGPTPKSVGAPVTDGMKLIISAMQAHGVRRLIATSTPSSVDPADRFAFSFWLATLLVRTLLRSAYDDVIGAAAAVRASGLDWTLVRLPMLTSKAAVLPPVADYVGASDLRLLSLSRNVLADFLVGQITDRTWIHKAPVLSNRM
jgi:nucleoside-diphosphate-sugar epimerase